MEKSLNLDVLRRHLAAKDPAHRIKALRSSVKYGDGRALEVILPLLPSETSPEVRATMIGVVSRLGEPAQFQTLFPYVEDESPVCRLAVAQAIVRLRHPSFFPLLVRLTGDGAAEIREFCGKALASLGKDNLFKLLEVMYGSTTTWMKRCAVRACRQFRSPALVAILEQALLDLDGSIVKEAKKGLRRLADHGIERAKELVEADFALVARDPSRPIPAPQVVDEVHSLDVSGPMLRDRSSEGPGEGKLDWGEYRASTEDLILPPPPEDLRAKVFGRDGDEVEDEGEEEQEQEQEQEQERDGAGAMAPAVVNPASMTPSGRRRGKEGSTNAMRSCTRCGETIRKAALKCRYCGEIFDENAYAVAVRQRGGMTLCQPYVKVNRLAAYMLDMVPAMLVNFIPILGAMLSGVWLVCRDGLEEGRFSFKRAVGLKVVDAQTGRPASLQQSIIRNCLFIPGGLGAILIFVPGLGPIILALMAMVTSLVFLIETVLVLMGRRRLTDTWAGTAIVQGDGARDSPGWAKAVIVVVPLIPVGLALLGTIFTMAAARGR